MKIRSGFSGERSLVLPRVIVQLMEDDPVTASLHISDLGYYPKAAHHYRRRDEPIDQCIFIYCIEGEGWYEINGRRYDVAPNQYFILPANTPIPMPQAKIIHGLYIGFTSEVHWPRTMPPRQSSR